MALAGELSTRATEQVYEGLFLNTVTGFEGFVETLFVGLLIDSHHGLVSGHDVTARVLVRSHLVARDLLVGPRQRYVDWLPYERTLEHADRLFRGARPFSLLNVAQKQTLDKAVKIRNAIAHKSRHSLKVFETSVIAGIPLPPRERTPAGFLRGLLMAAPPRTRFEDYSSSLLSVARLLAK